jgi:putative salt-induced outer membrane protein
MKQWILILFLASALPAVSARAQDAAAIPIPLADPLPPPPPPVIEAPPAPVIPPKPALDPVIRNMIDAAIQGGDFAAAEAVIKYARVTAPKADREIDAIETAWKSEVARNDARAAEERRTRLATAGVLENWKGQIELGGSRSTGTTRSLGIVTSADATREGLAWKHNLHAQAEFQRTDGVRTTERIRASWLPNYKFSERGYTYGIAQYERDPFAGYEDRYTAGAGIGYRVIAGPRMKLDLEGGPVMRSTQSITGDDQTRLAGRGSLNFNWQISPTLQFQQSGAVYVEHGDSNVTATTALDTKLIGALKARLSYNVQYEKDSPVGTRALNTQSRATLVYSF